MSADRNLLFGILALQLNFVTRDQLVEGMHAWVVDKTRSLGEIFASRKAMDEDQYKLLRALVDKHVERNGGDVQKSIQQLSSVDPYATQQLSEIEDSELHRTISQVPTSSFATKPLPATPFRSSNRFRIIRPHARGGLGEVFLAQDTELRREVALKEIQGNFAYDTDCRERFLREAEITGNLEHPGIVPVYALGKYDDGRPFYAMRFIRGESLKEAIDAFHSKFKSQLNTGEAGLELRKLLHRIVDVCNAIAYAHSRGVLHRDLKPGNIILGKYGETLVIDWGLAKAQGSAEENELSTGPVTPLSGSGATPTMLGSAVGTPAYMSPEQASGKVNELSGSTDVYSLGASLFHLLTGHLPIEGKSQFEMVRKAEAGEIRNLRDLRSDIPRALEAVCLKAMAKTPSERYSTPIELAEEIEKWLADEPVSAYVEPFSVRARRWVRRHPAIVSASAACTLLGLCAAVITAQLQGAYAKELSNKNIELTHSKNKAESEKSRAEQREQEAIAAVKRFGEAVSSNKELKNNPKLESLRKELLNEPLAFFKTLRERLQANKDTRPESLSRLAEAASDLGKLTNQISDKQNAILAYRESIEINQRLASENSSVILYEYDLARSHYNLGSLLSDTGKMDEALAEYNKAKTIFEKLATENPSVTEYLEDLGACHNGIGLLFRETGQLEKALASFKQYVAIDERLASQNPSKAKFQNSIATSLINIGKLLLSEGKTDESLAAYEKAKTIWEKLVLENPSVTEYRFGLAASHQSRELLFRHTGRPEESLIALNEAKSIWERLVDENPSVTEFQNNLAKNHQNFGNIFSDAGKMPEASAAYEEAKQIQERLVRENPTVTEYQSDLAKIHLSLGNLFYKTSRIVESLSAFEHAKTIQEKLAQENPSNIDYQSNLAKNLYNLGIVLKKSGQMAESLAAFEKAMKIRERLAGENPSLLELQNDLAASYLTVGISLSQLGKMEEAISSIDQAKTIRLRLVRENPSVIEFKQALAHAYNFLGDLQGDNGNPAEALNAFDQERSILEQLALDDPDNADLKNELGGTLNNIALIHLEAEKFSEARSNLLEAIRLQKSALEKNSDHPTYRGYLKNHYKNLIRAATGIQDTELLNEARRGLVSLATSDPAAAALDERLAKVRQGETAKNANELLSFGERCYELRQFVQAVHFFEEALRQDNANEAFKERPVRYNAACCAALAQSGQGLDDQTLDDVERTKLRERSLGWLKDELDRYRAQLETANLEQIAKVALKMKRWQMDADLASVREEESISKLSEADRLEWQSLWKQVRELQAKGEESK